MQNKQTLALKKLLDENYQRFHHPGFIEADPISIPHLFTKKEDIEISAFLTAIISWGQRKSILNNAKRLIEIMDQAPHDFILNHSEKECAKAIGFVHRTFNADDLIYFFAALQSIYQDLRGLEQAFTMQQGSMAKRLATFKEDFFKAEHLSRTEKHLANPLKGSSAKRLNMFLRWMVRDASGGVDFGLWNSISPAELMIPLDVHSAKVGRKLGLLKRKQNDWKAVEELTQNLRKFDAQDPIKYDFALFGMGVNGIES